MSIFADNVRENLTRIVRGHYDPDRTTRKKVNPAVNLKFLESLPQDIIYQAVLRTIAGEHSEHGTQRAERLLLAYSFDSLLYADGALDKLDLLETPQDHFAYRLKTMTDLIDLNDRFGGSKDFSEGLIGTMADYWTQIPIHISDLTIVFDTMARLYDGRRRFEGFRDWCSGYHFRDGILEVTEELAAKYGIQYDPNNDSHSHDFGVRKHGNRFVFPGVSAEEFMSVLCEANIKVAERRGNFPHLKSYHVKEGLPGWREAIRYAKSVA